MMSLALRFHIHCYSDDEHSVAGLMQISFEEVAETLSKLDRMFFEMDGSFVWTGNHINLGAWQVDGMVYDHNDLVQRLELKGAFPKENWRTLIQALRWPHQSLKIHDISAGEFLSIPQFESKIWGA